jgi:hypothetical protein
VAAALPPGTISSTNTSPLGFFSDKTRPRGFLIVSWIKFCGGAAEAVAAVVLRRRKRRHF